LQLPFYKCPIYVQQRYADQRITEGILGQDDPLTDEVLKLARWLVWKKLSAEIVTWTLVEMQRFDEECAQAHADRVVDQRLGK